MAQFFRNECLGSVMLALVLFILVEHLPVQRLKLSQHHIEVFLASTFDLYVNSQVRIITVINCRYEELKGVINAVSVQLLSISETVFHSFICLLKHDSV